MKKYCAALTKKNSRGLKKYYGNSGSEKFNQGKLDKDFYVCKHEKFSLIKSGIEPSLGKVIGSSKFKVNIGGPAAMKLDGVSVCTKFHL